MLWTKIWTHRPYSPAVMSTVVAATVRGFSEIVPESKIRMGATYWDGGMEDYFYPTEGLEQTVRSLNEEMIKNPERIFSFFEAALEKAKKLNEFSMKYKGKGLSTFSDEELLSHLKEFSKRFYDTYQNATLMIMLGYQPETPLYFQMMEILRKRAESEPEKFAEYLLILTRPPKRLKTQAQERRALEIAREAKKKGLLEGEKIAFVFAGELKSIAEEFKWLSYDFCISAGWDEGHYVGLVMEKLGAKFEDEISLIDNYEERVREDFDAISKKLGLNKAEISIFDHVGQMGYYKWAREHEFQQAIFNNLPIQVELGKRAGLAPKEAMFLLPEEIELALSEPQKFKEKALLRLKNMLYIADGQKTIILEGEEAKREYSKYIFSREKIDISQTELKGMPACAGFARGKVRIINTSAEMHKMQKGDILVSAATMPDLVPAMKKAAAIITNEGGIMCHAAIVSRELGIPCIVGVRNANKILKDGDEVEVDAAKGTIKKK
ncbi:MAG TPA: PEP-utilizing enzyme [Candidatus Norongarragalinales archaeon]|nr:PEP-utilizing enzyme [Candidatus Norongarragalinales archaeon]